MATKNTSYSSKKLSALLIFALSIVMSGCSGLRSRGQLPNQTGQKPVGRPDSSVKFPNQNEQVNTPATPVLTKKPRVGVILGPGGAKAYSHIGVLKELEKARIPVDYIVGIEHGALVASLYALNGKANEVEWKMNKIEHASKGSKGLFKSSSAPKISSLNGFISDNFPKKSISSFNVPFSCPMSSTQTGFVRMSSSGSIDESLKNCMPYLPLYQIDQDQIAGLFGIKESIDHLRSKGAELIIYVNVLDQGVLFGKSSGIEEKLSSLLWFEFRRSQENAKILANEVIDVTTRGIELADFKERRKLISLGEQSGAKAAQRLIGEYGF